MQDLSEALAEHAATFPSDGVDAQTLAHLKANLLDVVGVTLGGVNAEGLAQTREFLRATSASGASVVFGTADRFAAPGAALANTRAAHALEFDDALDEGGGMHAGPPVHASALAVADSLGGVSGAEYLAATAVGLDVAVRIALAPTQDFGWHRASVFSVFGATLAAGRLLRLVVEQMRNALGLALSQASGTRQSLQDRALSTRLHTGFAARNAVTAALLAQAGISGSQRIFEGANGFFPLFQRDAYNRDVVMEGLGAALLSSRISTKPFPGARTVHAFVEAALAIGADAGGEAIDRVVVHVPIGAAVANGEEYPTTFAATYSLRYSVALALATGDAPIGAFVDPRSAPPTVSDLYTRITGVADQDGSAPGAIEVVLADGRVMRRSVGIAKGSPLNPLSRDELLAKFWRLFEYAGESIPRAAATDAVVLIGQFETVASTATLTELLAGTEQEIAALLRR
jgi:2-methylcitrate dehydratase PrpD